LIARNIHRQTSLSDLSRTDKDDGAALRIIHHLTERGEFGLTADERSGGNRYVWRKGLGGLEQVLVGKGRRGFHLRNRKFSPRIPNEYPTLLSWHFQNVGK
jgi:hypothetical protein